MKKNIMKFAMYVVVLTFFFSFSSTALATGKNAIKLNFKYANSIEYNIYKVARFDKNEHKYYAEKPFELNYDLNNLNTAEKQEKVVKDFERQIKNVEPLKQEKTNKDGNINFVGLDDGMYLLVNTNSSEAKFPKLKGESFLVNLPTYKNGKYSNLVDASPKVSEGNEKTPESGNEQNNKLQKQKGMLPKTGGLNDPFFWANITIMIGMGMLVIGICINNKKKKEGRNSNE